MHKLYRHGMALAAVLIVCGAAPISASGNEPCKVAETTDANGRKTLLLENAHLKLAVVPAGGGAIRSLVLKRTGFEYANATEGFLVDLDYSIPGSADNDYPQQDYLFEITANTPERVAVTLKGQSKIPPLNWIEVSKMIALERNSAAVRVLYQYANHPDSMQPITIKPWIHNVVNSLGPDTIYLMPLGTGRYEIRPLKGKASSKYGKDVAQGWCAALDPGGNGLACLLPIKDVFQYYHWVNIDIGTLEWRITAQDVPNGKSFETEAMLLPFAGLADLSGGADGIVGGLVTPADVTQGKPAAYEVELLAAGDIDEVTIDARVRRLSDGEWKMLGEKQCALKAGLPAKLSFGQWTPDKPGTWVLQSRVSCGGKKLFDAEKTVVIGEATPGYILPLEGSCDASPNIIADSSAESKDAGLWSISNGGFDDTVCHAGRASIKVEMVNSPDGKGVVARRKIPVQPATKYTVSFWARVPVAKSFRLNVYDLDDNGRPIGEQRRCEVYFKERSSEWRRFEAVFESLPDAKFVAIYVYAHGDTGLFWIDDLIMAPGDPAPRVTPAQTDIPCSMDVVTPHVPWARPYARGPIKALMLVHSYAARDIVELAQRLEMSFETVNITGNSVSCGYASGSMRGRRVEDEQRNIREKLAQKYDLIVIGEISWQWLGEKARAAIINQVLAGAGLVYVQPNLVLDDLMKPEKAGAEWPMKFPGPQAIRYLRESRAPFRLKEHPITSGLPLKMLMPMRYGNWQMSGETLAAYDQQTPMLAVGQYGQGRVAALNYCTAVAWPYKEGALESGKAFTRAGLFPTLQQSSTFDPQNIKYRYWEYHWALLARTAAWAAGREPEVEIAGIEPDAGLDAPPGGPRDSVSVRFRCRRNISGTLYVEFYDEWAGLIATDRQKVKLDPGSENSFSFKAPRQAPAGLVFAELILRDAAGKSLNWAATAFENPKPARIEAIELDRSNSVYQCGEKVSATIRLSGNLPEASLRLDLVDTHERLLLTRTQKAAGQEVSIDFTPEHPRSVRFGLNATILQGDRVIDRAETRFTVSPVESPWDQYQFVISGLRAVREYLHDAMYKIYLEDGFTCVRGWDPLGNADHNMNFLASVGGFGDARHDVHSAWSKYLQTGDLKSLERNPPAYDEARWSKLQAGLERNGAFFAQVSPLIYGFGDENNIGGWECDYDYSKPTLDWFRKWLQERYGTLDKLNQQWETGFAKWEDVMPMPLPAAKQRSENLSPWADHRECMDGLFAEFHAQAKSALRQGDPNAICGISGTQHPDAYNGYDWWKLMKVFDALLAYGRGNQAEIQRSFKRVPSIGWAGYARTGPGVPYQFWSALMYNKQLALWRDWLVYEPDWRLCQSGLDYVRAAKPFMNGIGKLVMQSQWVPSGIAIHYSQASIRAAAGSKRASAFEQARAAWVTLIQDLRLQPDFVSYEQIEQGRLDPERYKVLILPESEAMSAQEVKAVRAFVEKGGAVIADNLAALRDEHCRLLPAAQLDDLFGIRRGPAGKDRLPRSIELRDGEGIKWPVKQLILSAADEGAGIVAASGKALGDCRGVPCFISCSTGRGRTVYLNFSILGYARAMEEGGRFRDVMKILLDDLGVSSPAEVVGEDGKPFFGCQVNMFRNGSEDIVAILPDLAYFQSMSWPSQNVTVKLPGKGWVHEVVTGRKIGCQAEAGCKLPMNEARLFAVLPAEITGVAIEGPGAAKPGELVKFAIKINSAGGAAKENAVLKDRQLVRIEVAGPDGKRRPAYSTIVWMAAEGGTHDIPLALNDVPGKWRFKAVHVVSGASAERNFSVR